MRALECRSMGVSEPEKRNTVTLNYRRRILGVFRMLTPEF